uniref:Uncharacterized protein n=1 Tax=Panagrolaimus davidi TaxID=227884 RepID=A0A914PN34_9BILA
MCGSPKKAAPPKGSKRRSFGSLFSRKKSNASKPSTTNSKGVSRFSRLGVRTPSQLPQKPKQPVVSVTSATAAAVQSKPKTPQKLGVAKPKDKSDKKKNVKKLQSKSESKISLKSSIDSPKKSEKEMKTAMEKSLREKKPKSASKSSIKSHGKDVSHESRRKNYQEVKISITNTDDGMTERKVTLINAYPQNEPPPKPFFGSLGCPPKKKSYASSKSVTSIDRLSPALLPSQPSASEHEFLMSPLKSLRASPSTKQQQLQLVSHKTYRDRALSTIHQLRASYQLSHHEIRNLSKNPELKITTIRAGNALLEAQRNLRNLKSFQILAGTNLLPDLTLFNDELSVVIHELDRFIDAIQTVSEHAETSP